MFDLTYDLARESAQYFRGAAGNIYPADYFAALRGEEIAGAGARHGQGDQGVPKGKGRIQRRVAQIVKERYGRIQAQCATGAINGRARGESAAEQRSASRPKSDHHAGRSNQTGVAV